jgi:hypothetical protein
MFRIDPQSRLRPLALVGVAAGLAFLLLASAAHAKSKKFGELLKRIPEQANALMLVDVDALLDSPYGQREKWRDQLADRPTSLLGISTDASRFVVATSIDPRTLDERWKVGMLQTKLDPPKPSVLANREGGYVEEIETQKVIWTPRGFYLFTFEPRIIGYAVPADRQLMVSWITSTLLKPREFPPSWADRAFFRADAGSPVVFAVNLKNVLSAREVQAWLSTLPAMKANTMDASILAPKLASAKSAMFQVDVDQTINGKIQVDFDQEVDYASPVAKEIILRTLESLGAALGTDAENWSAMAQGRSITLEGRLDPTSLRRILSLASAPTLTMQYSSSDSATPETEPSPGTTRKPSEPSDADIVKASQGYFRAITDITDNIQQKKNNDWTHIRFWMDKSARMIDELPILFVDTELLDWGAQVARTLRGMSQGINYVNKDKSYRLASSPKGSYVGYWGTGAYAGADNRLMNTQANSMISVGIDDGWKAFQNSMADMRRKMVQKYKVDF